MSIYFTIALIFLFVFIIAAAAVFIGGFITEKVSHGIDALDGEIGEDNGPKIISEFTLPSDQEELEKFKQQLLEERDKQIQDFVVEDLKDGVLGNLKK